jgi:hypothetical protein
MRFFNIKTKPTDQLILIIFIVVNGDNNIQCNQYQGEKVPAVVFMGFQMYIIYETGLNLLVVLRNNGVVSKSGLATNKIKNKKIGSWKYRSH